ncbi:MAG: DUF1592 domain-containing protein [Myxococcota bacterium]
MSHGRAAWCAAVSLLAACNGTIGDAVDEPAANAPAIEMPEVPDATEARAMVGPGRSKLRRLNAREYRNTIGDFFGEAVPDVDLPTDQLNGDGFDTDGATLSMAGQSATRYYDAAAAFASQVRASGGLSPFSHCASASGSELWNCLEPELGWWLERVFRRPVRDSTIDRLTAIGREVDEDYGSAVETLVIFALTSPDFLFHHVGEGEGDSPDAYEVANRLSYFLWSSGPDEALLERARDATILDAEVLEAETRRMLEDRRSERLYATFARQWIQVDGLPTVAVDDAQRALYEDLREETVRFIDTVFHEAPLDELLTAEWTFANASVAEHYGIDAALGEAFERVELPAERAGLLTHPSTLRAHSPLGFSDPIRRGFWTAERVVCNPPPPTQAPNVAPLGDLAPGETVRDVLAAHREAPLCASCHDYTDPYGLALELFDVDGRHRPTYDTGLPVDPSGTLPTGEAFDDLNELRDVLVARGDMARCINEYLTGYAIGRDLTEADVETAEHAFYDFLTDRGLEPAQVTLQDLIVRVVLSRQFQQAGVRQ